jgi:predicted PurR-regulated permease PerM
MDGRGPVRAPGTVMATAGRAVGVLALLVLLHLTGAVLVPISIALVLTLLLSAPVESMERRGIPPAASAAAIVLIPLAVLAGGALLLQDSVAQWLSHAMLPSGHPLVSASGGATLAPAPGGVGFAAWLQDEFTRQADTFAAQAWAGVRNAALYGATAAMLLFFALMSQRSLLAALLETVPEPRSRIRLIGGLREARQGVADYLYTMSVMNLALAAATGLALAALGLSHAVLWAVLIFGLLFIPYLGPLAIAALLFVTGDGHVAAMLPAMFGGSISGPLSNAIAPAIFLLLHCVESMVISPWFMGRNLRMNRVALLIAVIVGGAAWGLAGGVLAVPLLIIARAAARRMRAGRVMAILLRDDRSDAPPLESWLPGSMASRQVSDVARDSARESAPDVIIVPANHAVVQLRSNFGTRSTDLHQTQPGALPPSDIEHIASIEDDGVGAQRQRRLFRRK